MPIAQISQRGSSDPAAGSELGAGETALLLRISQVANRHRDREGLCAGLAQALEGVGPVERLEIAVAGPAGIAASAYSVPSGTPLYADQPITDDSALARVIREHQPLALEAAGVLGGGSSPAVGELGEPVSGSTLILPLLVQGRCLGALGLAAGEANAWGDGESAWLAELAGAVAIALDNCLAYEQVTAMGQELKALLDVSIATGRHLERDQLFGALAACLRGLLPTDRFGIELPLEGQRLQGHLLTPCGARPEPTRPEVLPATGTACQWVLDHHQWMVAAEREELRERFPVTHAVMSREGMESLCALPLRTGERCRGVLFFMAARKHAYEGLRRGLLDQVASAVAVALDDCLAHEEVRRLRDRLAAENDYLQEEIRQEHNFEEIVGRSAVLRRTLREVELVAPTESTVLIYGETGTGKELVARAIHARSARAQRPLIKVNCAAIPAGLVESELFGHEKGAFTGATGRRIGRFELAGGGTIFLDEIGELPIETQVSLLRVLQEREFERVGGSTTIHADVRVIAATNRDLHLEIAAGRFRQDLYYRLNVFPLRLPPLRERREDIELLAQYFLQRLARRLGRNISRISIASLERLRAYDWPGNVRELENLIERALIRSPGPILELGADLPVKLEAPRSSAPAAEPIAEEPAPAQPTTLAELQNQHLRAVLERCNWVVEGPGGAAQMLGLHPNTLRSRLKKLGLKRPSAQRQPA